MGQVPVNVSGKVKLGDYILPSGNNNGFGIAVSPADMRPSDYKKVVGVAWSESTNSTMSTINVAVGLNANSLTRLTEEQSYKIKEQEEEILALKASLNETKASVNKTNSILAQLVPGFKDAIGTTTETVKAQLPSVPQESEVKKVSNTEEPKLEFYTREKVEAIMQMAQEIAIKSGKDTEKVYFFNQYNTNPTFREIAIKSLEEKLNLHILEKMNKSAKN